MKNRKILYKIKWVGEKILSLLYPDICPFCGSVLKKEEEQICKKCELKLPYIYEPRCKKCGKPVGQETKEYCWDCEHHRHYYDRGYAIWEHQPVVAESIYQFKYHNRRIYSRSYAREMVKSYESIIRQWNIELIVPIPISKKRRHQRGYNQAELLAKEISRLTGIPYLKDKFRRKKDTVPQKSLNVRERRGNLTQAFSIEKDYILPPNILLVDDIYTTGNTIDMASYVLKKNGVKNVYFLTISIGQGY